MVLDFLKGQLWWILQITGSMGILVALAYCKINGLSWNSYSVYMGVVAVTAGWMFMVSYSMPGTLFFNAWFVGTAALALLGFLASKYYFKEALLLPNYIGAILILLGSVLLIIGKEVAK